MADFETTTDPDDCRVWAWGIAPVFKAETMWDVYTGTDIESFFDFLADMNRVVYFHNLAFDGAFIMDALFRLGFKHVSDRRLHPLEFTTLISDRSVVYSITVKWKSGQTTEFRDSYKKLPMTVERMAKAFQLPMHKGEIDYDAPRPVGHRLTMDERSYLCRDVLIVAKSLRFQLEAGMKKLTVGSDALHEYKLRMGGKLFQRTFPILPEEMDFRIRRAYRGGWTYKDKRRESTAIQGAGIVLDVNSLYPSVMKTRLLPYGEPVAIHGIPRATERYPLFITCITFTAKLKPEHVPCIQVKSNFMFDGTEYVEEIPEPVTLVCTNIDLALWQDQYDMDILAYEWSYGFNAMEGLFDDYIDHWGRIKAESVGGTRELAKLMMNSLYGKFATNPDVTQRYPIMEDGVVKLRNGPEQTRDPVYTPIGVFTTSYARDVTIRAAQANYSTFAYADTDSLHLLQTDLPESLEVHPTKLGAWKFEYAFVSARFIRAKQYIEQLDDGSHVVHIAGLSRSVATTLTLDGVTDGMRLPSLKAKRVPGGIVLQDVGFILKLC
jgi:hypothetical protein